MSGSSRWLDHGLLVLRVGIGGMFMAHGWPKLAGGAKSWAKLGGAMAHLGLDFWPTFWGFSAACAEFFGGMLIALGLLFKPACGMLLATMAVAATMHIRTGDGVMGASHAIELGILFASLMLIGPGKYALAEKLGKS
jgi:putative oxidoreductase